jgi:signal transduction histidine kinase
VIDGDALPAEYQPWVWWVIGMSVISVGVTAPIWLGFSFLITTSVVWFFVDTSYFGGYSDPWVSMQDSVYAFLVGGSVSGLILMVKQAARQTDIANSAVIKSSIQQAQVDAVERERQRIDALVHDRVLNTLVLASKANSSTEQRAVEQMSKDAITSLEEAGNEPKDSGEVTLLGLYRALRKAAVRMIPSIEVETTSAGLLELPGYVAEAVTEATIQALDNAARHSNARNIRLYLGSSSANDLVIKLIDDGIGFKLDRIAKDRIGIRTSISARLEMAGARAEIITNPGDGTTIVIRWNK